MRRSTAHNRKPDRERLVFAVCQECGKVTAVYIAKGQDIAAILHDNKMRPTEGIYRRDVISVKCVSCYEIEPMELGPGLKAVIDLQRQINQDIEKMCRGIIIE